MRVAGIALNHCVKIRNCFFMLVNHLIGFCTLMYVIQVAGIEFDTLGKRKDSFLKLLLSAVGETQVIENITLVALLRFLFQRFFQILEARFVLFFSKEGES